MHRFALAVIAQERAATRRRRWMTLLLVLGTILGVAVAAISV